MRRTLTALLLAALAAGGCEKSENKPNPEFKVPEVQPGRGSGGEAPKNPKS